MKLFGRAKRAGPRDLHERFEQIATTLDHFDLQRIEPGEITLDERSILADLEGEAHDDLFLGYYSREGLKTAFREYGVLAKLEA
ncbi:MAG: hypothetical protein KC466_09210, partial [Myxococcales bacterium]|nr:hypothetical protein [Myxococcales bacterium]